MFLHILIDAFLMFSIEVKIVFKTIFPIGLNEGLAKRMIISTYIIDIQWPTFAAILITTIGIGFRFFKVGQHIIPSPALITEIAPVIKICRLAPK
jgi:hypothetical protein